jgi:hypothetical protein
VGLAEVFYEAGDFAGFARVHRGVFRQVVAELAEQTNVELSAHTATMGDVAVEIETAVNASIRCLQFEDIVRQSLDDAKLRSELLGKLCDHLTENPSMHAGEAAEIASFIENFRQAHRHKVGRGVVTQDTMAGGSVELF